MKRRTRDGVELPDEVAKLIERHLPAYRSNRERWPGWTLGPSASELGSEPLFEIYRWSVPYLLNEHIPGWALDRAHAEMNAAAREISYRALAQASGIAASQSSDIPLDVEALAFFDQGHLGLESEIEELLEWSLRPALYEMISDFRDAYELAAYSGPGRKKMGASELPQLEDLALRFCERAGLSRAKGTRIRVSDRCLSQLRIQMDSVVEAVSLYKPDDEMVDLAEHLFLAEPTAMPLMDQERLRRDVRAHVEPFLRHIRFPFLTAAELTIICVEKARQSDKAFDVLAARLPGDVKAGTIRNRLSKAGL